MRATQNGLYQLFGRVKLQLNPHAPMTLQYPAVTDLPPSTSGTLSQRKSGLPAGRNLLSVRTILINCQFTPRQSPGQPARNVGQRVDGPWHVDYHNNINIQMNYWPACSTNLNECVWPLIDFIRTLVKPGEKTAQAYFGARGWTAPYPETFSDLLPL